MSHHVRALLEEPHNRYLDILARPGSVPPLGHCRLFEVPEQEDPARRLIDKLVEEIPKELLLVRLIIGIPQDVAPQVEGRGTHEVDYHSAESFNEHFGVAALSSIQGPPQEVEFLISKTAEHGEHLHPFGALQTAPVLRSEHRLRTLGRPIGILIGELHPVLLGETAYVLIRHIECLADALRELSFFHLVEDLEDSSPHPCGDGLLVDILDGDHCPLAQPPLLPGDPGCGRPGRDLPGFYSSPAALDPLGILSRPFEMFLLGLDGVNDLIPYPSDEVLRVNVGPVVSQGDPLQ